MKSFLVALVIIVGISSAFFVNSVFSANLQDTQPDQVKPSEKGFEGDPIQLTGINLTGQVRVFLEIGNGQTLPLSVTLASSSEAYALLPESVGPGVYELTACIDARVCNPPIIYTVLPSVVVSVMPGSAYQGEIVRIVGSNIEEGMEVSIESTEGNILTLPLEISGSFVSAEIPKSANTGTYTLTVCGGKCTAKGDFVVSPFSLGLLSIAPVTIYNNQSSDLEITLPQIPDDILRATLVNTSTQILLESVHVDQLSFITTVPANTQTGKYDLRIESRGQVTTSTQRLVIKGPINATITDISPAKLSRYYDEQFSLIIDGENLSDFTAVRVKFPDYSERRCPSTNSLIPCELVSKDNNRLEFAFTPRTNEFAELGTVQVTLDLPDGSSADISETAVIEIINTVWPWDTNSSNYIFVYSFFSVLFITLFFYRRIIGKNEAQFIANQQVFYRMRSNI